MEFACMTLLYELYGIRISFEIVPISDICCSCSWLQVYMISCIWHSLFSWNLKIICDFCNLIASEPTNFTSSVLFSSFSFSESWNHALLNSAAVRYRSGMSFRYVLMHSYNLTFKFFCIPFYSICMIKREYSSDKEVLNLLWKFILRLFLFVIILHSLLTALLITGRSTLHFTSSFTFTCFSANLLFLCFCKALCFSLPHSEMLVCRWWLHKYPHFHRLPTH